MYRRRRGAPLSDRASYKLPLADTADVAKSEKARLRAQVRAARRQLKAQAQTDASFAVLAHALTAELFFSGQHVAAYMAIGSELSLKPLLAVLLARGVFVYLPKVLTQKGEMQFLRYHGEAHLESGKFGILAPVSKSDDAVAASELDVILLPLLAFDAQGYRLGQGGGYYDRYLHALVSAKPLRVGVAFHFQAVKQLPTESFDQQLHAAITELGVIRFSANLQGASTA